MTPMMTREADSERVLVWASSARDAEVACHELGRHGIAGAGCSNAEALCESIRAGAGAVVVAEEQLTAQAIAQISAVLAMQAPWSDMPVLIASRRERSRDWAEHLAPLGNVTLLDTPLRLRTLVQATRTALRARRRQYDARRAIHRRDQFLAMLGHELRNPLSSIALAGERLQETVEEGDPALAVLRRQTQQLTRLVDDLLDVARITTGKLELAKRPLDLSVSLSQWVEAWRPRFDAAGVALSVECPERVFVDADAARLEQAFGNLLTNCVKYTPDGGHAVVRVSVEGDRARVRVEDDGVGMDPSVLATIFDEFVQVEGSLDRSQGGMGVGLTLVRTLIELHGGTVEAESAGLGQGSAFIVELPLAPDRGPDVRAPLCGGSRAASRHIVLVEDNADAREMMELALQRRGHRVVSAEDGVSGVELVLRERPDAAVVDIGLPGMDGYAVARTLRESLGPELVLIAASGYGQPSDRRQAREAGFDLHLTKPVSADAIQEQVERLLRR